MADTIDQSAFLGATAADPVARRLYEEVRPSMALVEESGETSSGFAFQAYGSGFFADSRHLVTAAHVVDAQKEITVTDQRGRIYPAKVDAVDELNDVATLSLEGYRPGTNPPLKAGTVGSLKPEDQLYHFGYVKSLDPLYITSGKVMTLAERGRWMDFAEGKKPRPCASVPAAQGQCEDYDKLIHGKVIFEQGSVRNGMSGGPVIDKNGTVVGINSMSKDNVAADALIDSVNNLPASSRFTFSYVHRPADWAYSAEHDAVAAVTEAALAGGAGFLLKSAFASHAGIMGVAGTVYSLHALTEDATNLLNRQSWRNKLHYGVAALGDIAMLAGSQAQFVPRFRAAGSLAFICGLATRLGADFIPDHLVLDKTIPLSASPKPLLLEEVLSPSH